MDYVTKSEEIALWIHSRTDGIETVGSERTRTVGGCFDSVLEHQVSISILLKNQLFGSVFALARSVFEGYVRGVWLQHCATDKQISDFLNDKFEFTFQNLIDDIEKVDGYSVGVISAAKKAGWKILNGYTHTGAIQVLSRNSDCFIGPNYDEKKVKAIADFVNATALLAGIGVVLLARQPSEQVAMEFLEKIKEYVGVA